MHGLMVLICLKLYIKMHIVPFMHDALQAYGLPFPNIVTVATA